jgi:hypothetical protein
VRPAGDGNGDGCADLAVGAPYQDGSDAEEGAVYWFPGGPTGIREDGIVRLAGSPAQAAAHFGASVTVAGDLDDDGYADLAIGEPGFDPSCEGTEIGCGRVFIYAGARGGISPTAMRVFQAGRHSGVVSSAFGRGLFGGGDADGDGRPDLLVLREGEVGTDGTSEAAALFLSRSGLLSGTPDRQLTAASPHSVCIGTPGDVNGDGLADLVLGLPSHTPGGILVFYGTAEGFAATATTVVPAPTILAYDFGGSIG